jgi:hypothetical protein
MNIIEKLIAEHEVWLKRATRRPTPRVTKKDRPKCGAFARSTGQPCKAKALANGRCRNHGGMSTGPRTPEGRARSLANLKQFRNQ